MQNVANVVWRYKRKEADSFSREYVLQTILRNRV